MLPAPLKLTYVNMDISLRINWRHIHRWVLNKCIRNGERILIPQIGRPLSYMLIHHLNPHFHFYSEFHVIGIYLRFSLVAWDGRKDGMPKYYNHANGTRFSNAVFTSLFQILPFLLLHFLVSISNSQPMLELPLYYLWYLRVRIAVA